MNNLGLWSAHNGLRKGLPSRVYSGDLIAFARNAGLRRHQFATVTDSTRIDGAGSSSSAERHHAGGSSSKLAIGDKQFQTDSWTNTPPSILAAVPRRLHVQPDHPLTITRKLIESRFPGFKTHNNFFPVVSTLQNFDSLGFPSDHPGRSRTDTYYVNQQTVLRTHTSAHQLDVFRSNQSSGWLISADVYRRDAVDKSHYPVFHQMEGARMWDRATCGDDVSDAVRADLKALPHHNLKVEDPNPTVHPERNPLQGGHHKIQEVEAIAAHLKKSLEDVVVQIFDAARRASAKPGVSEEPLRVRWIEAYFPFTSPSWELEVYWEGDWLEVLGCGVVKQDILIDAGVPTQLGWAFGLGLERIAMLLFNIPDIRLFWSQDQRFLSQFSEQKPIQSFAPFSKYPACYKDVSFWLGSTSSSAGGGARANSQDFHENDVMQIVRNVAGDLVEDVRLEDEFVHPKTQRKSKCYRLNYRSLERTLLNDEINVLHSQVCKELVEKMGVELR